MIQVTLQLSARVERQLTLMRGDRELNAIARVLRKLVRDGQNVVAVEGISYTVVDKVQVVFADLPRPSKAQGVTAPARAADDTTLKLWDEHGVGFDLVLQLTRPSIGRLHFVVRSLIVIRGGPANEESARRLIDGGTTDRSEPEVLTAKAGKGDEGAASAKGTSPSEPEDQTKVAESDVRVQIWFATNRVPLRFAGKITGFSPELANEMTLGSCKVVVGAARPIGGRPSGFLRRVQRSIFRAQEDVVVESHEVLAPAKYWAAIREGLDRMPPADKSAMVFVHGYYNTFESAIKTAAALDADVGGWSVTACFCWPSQGAALGYARDAEMAAVSEVHFEEFLRDLVARTGVQSVHVIAHSMGNRVVLGALERIHISKTVRPKCLKSLVFAAPDVDRPWFVRMAPRAAAGFAQSTLYCCSRDSALKKSRDWANHSDRAGLHPPLTVCTGIFTIDVTDVDLSDNGHRAFRESPAVLSDLHYMTRFGHGPKERHGLMGVPNDKHPKHWQFKPVRSR